MKKLFSLILLTLSLPVFGMQDSGAAAGTPTAPLEVKTNDEQIIQLSPAEIASLGKNNFLAIHARTPGFQDSVPNLEYVSTSALKSLLHIGALTDHATNNYLESLDDQAIFEILVACDFLMCFQDEQKQSIIATTALNRLMAGFGNKQEDRDTTAWLLEFIGKTPSAPDCTTSVFVHEYDRLITQPAPWQGDSNWPGYATTFSPAHTDPQDWTRDRQILAKSKRYGTAITLYGATGAILYALPDSDGCVSLAWSPDGKTLAAGTLGAIKLWNVVDRVLAHSIHTNEPPARFLAWSPNGRFLAASTGPRGPVVFVDTTDGSILKKLDNPHDGNITAISWAAGGRILLVKALEDYAVDVTYQCQSELLTNASLTLLQRLFLLKLVHNKNTETYLDINDRRNNQPLYQSLPVQTQCFVDLVAPEMRLPDTDLDSGDTRG